MTEVALTPVMRQYREAKEQHPDGILMFRLGDFYEIFFEDAEIAAPVMGVTLTSRPLGKTGRAPMCGVPHHAWQSYVGKLLRAGYKVESKSSRFLQRSALKAFSMKLLSSITHGSLIVYSTSI